ncbi:hypothetical protein Pd630_LPD16174 (plasmid) [Rhodococcus opacus PD630]|nr:hypothetical protein Pd630_LPD16174 [Rhodococcus opacus PD630]
MVQSGRRDEAIKILRPMFDQVRNEPGTLLYLMHVSRDEPDVIWFYERYADESAFAAHTESAVHHSVVEQLMPLLVGDPEATFLELLAEKGLPGLEEVS